MKKQLLLHICCAPCAVYVFDMLRRTFQVTGYFYNPNIHPLEEHEFRAREMRRLAKKLDWPVIYGEASMDDWFARTRGHETDPERGERCAICFDMRLASTFRVARSRGFEVVASTLSISPYKNSAQINRRGEALQREYGIEFLAENFKRQDGFAKAKEMAQAHQIQHQQYCGCIYSMRDRQEKQRDRSP